jgi:hypothetical protein
LGAITKSGTKILPQPPDHLCCHNDDQGRGYGLRASATSSTWIKRRSMKLENKVALITGGKNVFGDIQTDRGN